MRGVFRLLRPIFFAIKHFPQPPSSLPYLRHLLLVLISRLPHLLQFESMLLLGGCGGFFEAVEDFGVVGTGGEGSGGGVQGEVGRQFRGGSGLMGEFEQQVQAVLLVGVELLGKHADCLVIIKDYLPSDLSQNLHSLPTALTASASPAPPRPPLPTLLPWQKLHVISSL